MGSIFFKKIISKIWIALSIVFLCTASVSAATIAVVPSDSTITEGATFSVVVRVNTQGKNVNVAEAKLTYPSSILQVVSVTPGNTFTLQTPGSLSRTPGEISFSAGLPSPGYNGANGVLQKITFRAIAPGSATIRVASGKVLLNDGNGTDVYSGGIASTISVAKPAVKPPTKPVEEVPVPPVAAPEEVPVVVPIPVVEEVPVPQTEPQIVPEPINTQETTSMTPTNTAPIVATITIDANDLIAILYVLLSLVVILLIILIFTWRKNSMLRQQIKDTGLQKVKLSVKSQQE